MLIGPTQNSQITSIQLEGGNDLSAIYTVRYRLESDPDVDASYSPVTTTKNVLGVIIPYFDTSTVVGGIYVVHTYENAAGSTTGTKQTVVVVPIDASEPATRWDNLTGGNIFGITFQKPNGMLISNIGLAPGASICVKDGTLSGTDSGLLTDMGAC